MSKYFQMYAERFNNKKGDNSKCVIADGETTFVADDGLHYCVVCDEPLQQHFKNHDKMYILPSQCSCITKYDEHKELIKNQQENLKRIPIEFRGVFLKDLTTDVPFAKSYIVNFDTKFKPNVVGLHVFGNVGSGKTYAYQCIINELAKQGVRIFAMRFTKLVDIVSNFNNHLEIKELESKIKNSHLIFLDDLGATRETDFVAEKINDIINFMYQLNIPIIITSNVSRTDLYKNLNTDVGRAYSRLFERCVPQKLTNESYRLKKAKENMDKYADILNGNYQ